MSIVSAHLEQLVDERAGLFKKLVRLRVELQNPDPAITAAHLQLMTDQEAAMTNYCAALKRRISDLEVQMGIYCG